VSKGKKLYLQIFVSTPTQPVPVIRQNPRQPERELSLNAVGSDSVLGEELVGAADG
jgi:hypothetical protein